MWWLKIKKYFSLLALLVPLFYFLSMLLSLGQLALFKTVLMVLYPLAVVVFILAAYKSLLYLSYYQSLQFILFFSVFFIILTTVWILADEVAYLAASNFIFWLIIYKQKIYARNHLILKLDGGIGYLFLGRYKLKIEFAASEGIHNTVNYILFYAGRQQKEKNYLPLYYNYFSYTLLKIGAVYLLYRPLIKHKISCIEFILLPVKAINPKEIIKTENISTGSGNITVYSVKKLKFKV